VLTNVELGVRDKTVHVLTASLSRVKGEKPSLIKRRIKNYKLMRKY
jgi:hypothetical protein